jgi:threonine dehydrogenase-like Zn-dependent dehydrogenase
MFAEKQGAVQIVGIDLEEYRCKKSLELGATGTINASNDEVLEAGKEITHGELFDVVVDATGNPAGLDTCVGLVRPQGQVISFSLVGERSVPFNHRGSMAKNLQINSTLIAATGQPVQEIREIVALRDRGWIDPGVLKTHEMSFDEVYDAYEMYRKREDGVIKIALRLG